MPLKTAQADSHIRDIAKAVDKNNVSAAQQIIDTGNISSAVIDSLLLQTTRRGPKLDAISALLLENGGSKQTALNGRLNYAASIGDVPKMQNLKDQGADILNTGHYPLTIAALNGHLAAAKFAHENGAKFDEAFPESNTYAIREILNGDGGSDKTREWLEQTMPDYLAKKTKNEFIRNVLEENNL